MWVINCICIVPALFPVARHWLWTSWAWGCCHPAARWQTLWQKASPVRDERRSCPFSVHFLLFVYAPVYMHMSVSVLSSCGGHQQETRASSQPGGHFPDYTHWKGLSLIHGVYSEVCLWQQACVCSRGMRSLCVSKHPAVDSAEIYLTHTYTCTHFSQSNFVANNIINTVSRYILENCTTKIEKEIFANYSSENERIRSVDDRWVLYWTYGQQKKRDKK